jgi:hypothetical protein
MDTFMANFSECIDDSFFRCSDVREPCKRAGSCFISPRFICQCLFDALDAGQAGLQFGGLYGSLIDSWAKSDCGLGNVTGKLVTA